MEFFIRQGASDPILKMGLIDDGKNDKSSFNDILENSDITFEMYDYKKDQVSLIHVTVGGKRQSTKLTNPTDKVVFNF